MIFDTAEVRCIIDILQILDKGESKYSFMFKETKVSHTTLQIVLKKLISVKFIRRHDIGHMNVDYKITEKGRELLKKLKELKDFLR